MDTTFLNECLPHLEKPLLEAIATCALVEKFPKTQYIVRQGQYIRFLPIVLRGNVKVFSQEDTIQFLLYYINPGDPCIFSFAHIFDFNDAPIEFSAIAETDSELLMLPIHQVHHWIRQYVSFNQMLLKGYQRHYQDLLHTTKQVTCYNLEERLLNYLTARTQIAKTNTLAISHQDIANDLGTSREVISRLMKKMGANQKVKQVGRKIKVL